MVFATLSGGCADAEEDVRIRAANDFSCNPDKITIQDIGGDAFRAKGCGNSRVYDCVGSDSFRGTTTGYSCRPEKGTE
jgi:hypothetical protein